MDSFLKSEVTVRETRRNGDGIPEDYWGKLLVPWQVQALSGINGTMVILPGVKKCEKVGDEIIVHLDAKNPDVKWDPLPPPPPPVNIGPVDIEKAIRDALAALGITGIKLG